MAKGNSYGGIVTFFRQSDQKWNGILGTPKGNGNGRGKRKRKRKRRSR